MYQQNNSFVYIHIGFMVYVEEKVKKNVRLRYCDGKDKYLHTTGVKDVEYIFFFYKQLAKHLILSQE